MSRKITAVVWGEGCAIYLWLLLLAPAVPALVQTSMTYSLDTEPLYFECCELPAAHFGRPNLVWRPQAYLRQG